MTETFDFNYYLIYFFWYIRKIKQTISVSPAGGAAAAAAVGGVGGGWMLSLSVAAESMAEKRAAERY